MKQKIRDQIGGNEPLLEVARRKKLQWFVLTTRRPGSLARDVMHGLVELDMIHVLRTPSKPIQK